MMMQFHIVNVIDENGRTSESFGPFTSEARAEKFRDDIERSFTQEDMESGWSCAIVKLQRPVNGYREPVGCTIEIEV